MSRLMLLALASCLLTITAVASPLPIRNASIAGLRPGLTFQQVEAIVGAPEREYLPPPRDRHGLVYWWYCRNYPDTFAAIWFRAGRLASVQGYRLDLNGKPLVTLGDEQTGLMKWLVQGSFVCGRRSPASWLAKRSHWRMERSS